MDLAGGTLSYEGIDVLRRVETCGVERFRGSIIPSKSDLKRMAASVEWYARKYCPFSLKILSKGKAIEFDYAQTMHCITRAFHLDEIGKVRSLSVASSIDGASLSKNLSMIAGGIKIIDQAARCPLTRRPLLDNPATMSAQSRNLCIPLKIMMGRETKETFTEFRTLFSFLDDLSNEATMPSELEAFKPFSSRCLPNAKYFIFSNSPIGIEASSNNVLRIMQASYLVQASIHILQLTSNKNHDVVLLLITAIIINCRGVKTTSANHAASKRSHPSRLASPAP